MIENASVKTEHGTEIDHSEGRTNIFSKQSIVIESFIAIPHHEIFVLDFQQQFSFDLPNVISEVVIFCQTVRRLLRRQVG